MIGRTHISELTRLLQYVPAVTEEQAVIYLAKLFKEKSAKPLYRSINQADSYNMIWREHVGNTIRLSINREKAQSIAAKDFPYVFWMYLGANMFDRPCELAEHPFLTTFTRKRKDGSDVIAQIAFLDCKGTQLPLILANEVFKTTDSMIRQWRLMPEELPKIYWRALVLKDMPRDFIKSRDFELLQGVGFTSFFEVRGYHQPPRLVAKQSDAALAWRRCVK